MRISWREICVALVSVSETVLANIDAGKRLQSIKSPAGWLGIVLVCVMLGLYMFFSKRIH